MKIKKIAILIVLYLLNTNILHSIEADIFVQSTINRASKILSENTSKEEKIEKLKSVAEDTVDITGIGFYTLGSKRKTLSDEIPHVNRHEHARYHASCLLCTSLTKTLNLLLLLLMDSYYHFD